MSVFTEGIQAEMYTTFQGRDRFFIAQTYHRARDSTQTLWTRLSCRSLGSNRSRFT